MDDAKNPKKKQQKLLDIVNTNYRHTDSHFDRGFIKSIIAFTNNNHESKYTLLRRYILALKNLAKNNNITITSSDKGGEIIVLDTIDYYNKLTNLLNDKSLIILPP